MTLRYFFITFFIMLFNDAIIAKITKCRLFHVRCGMIQHHRRNWKEHKGWTQHDAL